MLPRFLAATFDLDALAKEESTLIAIDPSHKIRWVNPAWTRFALANGGDDVVQRFGTGSSYLDGTSGPARSFYEEALTRAAKTRTIFEHDYECSSPETFRRFHLRALPCDDAGLLLEHSLVVEHPHDRVESEIGHEGYVRDNGFILQCSNCRRVRHKERSAWDWVPFLVRNVTAKTSHGLCAACEGFYWRVK